MLRGTSRIATTLGLALGALALMTLLPAFAGETQRMQIGMQDAGTPVSLRIHEFYNFVNIIIIAITLFVLALLVYVLMRFNARANPEPASTTHNAALEIAWTIIPVFILVMIAVPSFKLLNLQYTYPKPDLTIKATGYTWYWSHEYPDQGGFSIDSVVLGDDDRQELIKKGIPAPRLLAVDNEIVVPAGKVVHVLVTSADVIHSWTVPAFGSNTDAVPGRLTSTWFQVPNPGIYYGDCTQLCGKDHSAMPIAIRVVPEATFNDWAAAMKAKDKKKAKAIIEKAALEQAGSKSLASAAR
jgi:cytochrome c oxidase subunit II